MGRNAQPESMDIYDLKLHKGLHRSSPLIVAADCCILGPSKDDMQLQLMNDESPNAGTKGGATIIGQGLKIKESQ
jgi:hypothetical protein